jgi:MOSC domain-containing protein YiiM
MGENVTTRGLDLLGLPEGARLHLGEAAVVEVTGLRTPCGQLDRVRPGLMEATRQRVGRRLVCRAGIMAVVIMGGDVRPGDAVAIELPPGPHRPLRPV